jgi:hypothetical protein
MKGFPQIASSQQNHRYLRSTHATHFKVSRKEESHEVDILGRIDFSITGQEKLSGRREKHFLFPRLEMQQKPEKWWFSVV